MADVLKKFGRYFLLDQLAQGGMAEIFRARLATIDGAGRLIVIKRIQAGQGENSEFLQMFRSEIKVTMGFNHPNIVQLYDFGEEEQQPYIAMEYLDGKNVRQFLSRFNELKQSFPVELATYVIEQSASGLHYAHAFKDKFSGQPLNIVHRDISPQNILISYEGNVKVIDFGIAKATTNLESTRAGVIKGKPSYLSPEQISGESLDGRCDLFALGAVLWELLTGKKLFAGESDLAVLKLIESCQTYVKPPSTLNPKVPKELDYIVLKCLAKNRDKRYQTAEELQRALHKFLYSYMAEFNPSDLAYYAKDLFKNDIVEDRKRIQKLNDKAEALLCNEVAEGATKVLGESPPRREETRTVLESKRTAQVVPDLATPGRGPRVEMEASRAGASQVRGTSGVSNTRTGLSPMSPPRAQGSGTFPSARMGSAKRVSSSRGPSVFWSQLWAGSRKIALLAAVGAVGVVLFGPQYGIRVPVVSDLVDSMVPSKSGVKHATSAPVTEPVGEPERSTASVSKSAVPVGAPAGAQEALIPGKSLLLRLNVVPGAEGTQIMLGGVVIDNKNPSRIVSLDSPLELVVDRPGFKPLKREFVLESRQYGGLQEWSMDVALEPQRVGFLTIHTTPSAEANISLEGKLLFVKKTPFEQEKMPAGALSIRLVNSVLGMEKTVQVVVEEGKITNLDERLEVKN
ncbi:serine/threonine-protein kinase [Bdellovibrionota bacterium FG-2]